MTDLGELVGTFIGAGLVLAAVAIALRRRGGDASAEAVPSADDGWVTTV